jgi:hypothetical protein
MHLQPEEPGMRRLNPAGLHLAAADPQPPQGRRRRPHPACRLDPQRRQPARDPLGRHQPRGPHHQPGQRQRLRPGPTPLGPQHRQIERRARLGLGPRGIAPDHRPQRRRPVARQQGHAISSAARRSRSEARRRCRRTGSSRTPPATRAPRTAAPWSGRHVHDRIQRTVIAHLDRVIEHLGSASRNSAATASTTEVLIPAPAASI